MITNDYNVNAYLGSHSNHASWIAEAIWGHRLEAQPDAGLLLEFLSMAEGLSRKGELLDDTSHGKDIHYVAYQSLQLRNLLFNNPRMEEILDTHPGDDRAAWDEWLKDFRETARVGSNLPSSFDFLRNRFDSFESLVHYINLLRRIVYEQENKRSWTTHFLYPIGPAAIYEALSVRNEAFERTRDVFTRTGEIAYLMLSRASSENRERLKDLLLPLFSSDTPRNRMLQRLISTETPDQGTTKGETYLPYKAHPAFDRFAEDLISILSLGLPEQDAYLHFPPVIAFNLYLYGLETGNSWIGRDGIPPISCEILAPKSDVVRRISVATYLDNELIGLKAVKQYTRKAIESDEELQGVLQSEEIDESEKIEQLNSRIRETCHVDSDKFAGQPTSCIDLRRKFDSHAERIYREGVGSALRSLGRSCGLVSKQGTNRLRYSPTDEFLQMLVFTNVTEPIEESDFLRGIHARYRLAIGPAEAAENEPAFGFDKSDFERNQERFTQRLIGLGLARRMSDSCTYIENPMF